MPHHTQLATIEAELTSDNCSVLPAVELMRFKVKLWLGPKQTWHFLQSNCSCLFDHCTILWSPDFCTFCSHSRRIQNVSNTASQNWPKISSPKVSTTSPSRSACSPHCLWDESNGAKRLTPPFDHFKAKGDLQTFCLLFTYYQYPRKLDAYSQKPRTLFQNVTLI